MELKDLEKIKLPLSPTDYQKLRNGFDSKQIEWSDLSKELQSAVTILASDKAWKKMLDSGQIAEWD